MNNNRVEDEMRKLERDGSYLANLSVDRNEVEDLRSAAQFLFNAYGSKKDATLIKNQLLKVQVLLNGFDDEVISKIPQHSDA